MSEISINTVKNIDEIDQIILLTTCTTKLHRYYRITLHFLDFPKSRVISHKDVKRSHSLGDDDANPL